MTAIEKFAHGNLYGDYSGAIFYGPPCDGSWHDRLAVSDRYIAPLFYGILDAARLKPSGQHIPRLVADWNTLQGWEDRSGPVPIADTDATELAEALAHISLEDISKYCAGSTSEECLRCAVVIRNFIVSRLTREVSLFIEND